MPTSPAQRREWGEGEAAKVAMPRGRRASTDQHQQHVRVEIPRADEPRSCNTAAGVTLLTTRRDLENFRFRVIESEIGAESPGRNFAGPSSGGTDSTENRQCIRKSENEHYSNEIQGFSS
ncbi:hypothetical protein Y032_0614g687 [Ancylostoma ceylanicum]|uniref:Uncharacterized protein n=1 Tax=Ancylostoma ceylanicum TaxID=53326 RepID=A0A016WLB4_9BILA|nr:hypothetical protein Y032_0614g687 [Ancylostoma ceylanicum]